MAEKRLIRYGGQTTDVPDGMTLEQAKQQMARFFPELADPKVETKKEKDVTVWEFSKKAGTKGASKRHVRRKSCEGKVRYVNHADADQNAMSARRRTRQNIQAYKCRFCSGYHIGHPMRPHRTRREHFIDTAARQ